MTDDVTPDDVAPSAAAAAPPGAAGEPVGGPPAELPASGPSAEPPALPSQRMVSDDELLDLDAGPADHEPLVRLAGLLRLADRPSPHRLQHLVRVALVVLAVVAVAGAAGVATHTADVHRAQDRLRDRTLLRLVGGSALVGFPGTVPLNGETVTTQLEFAVRNDGAQPESVAPLGVDAPGVKIVNSAGPVVIPSGGTGTVRLPVAVDCASTALVKQPNSVTLHAWAAPGAAAVGQPAPVGTSGPVLDGSAVQARTEASPTAGPAPNAKTTTVTLPFSVSSSRPRTALTPSGQVVDTFYDLCGFAAVGDNGPVTSYLGPSGEATKAKPTATFQIAVRSDFPDGPVLAIGKPFQDYPGLTISGLLPAASVPLADATPVQAGVTVRVTDCTALASALSGESGIQLLLQEVANRLPLISEPADPRFRGGPGTSKNVMVNGNLSAFEQDLLVNLVAACPNLR